VGLLEIAVQHIYGLSAPRTIRSVRCSASQRRVDRQLYIYRDGGSIDTFLPLGLEKHVFSDLSAETKNPEFYVIAGILPAKVVKTWPLSHNVWEMFNL